jgi:hypothetical protein
MLLCILFLLTLELVKWSNVFSITLFFAYRQERRRISPRGIQVSNVARRKDAGEISGKAQNHRILGYVGCSNLGGFTANPATIWLFFIGFSVTARHICFWLNALFSGPLSKTVSDLLLRLEKERMEEYPADLKRN